MKKRMHLKKKRKKANYFLLFLIIILTLFVFVFIKFKNIEPLIISYSEMEANKLATLIINVSSGFKLRILVLFPEPLAPTIAIKLAI